MKGTRTWYVVHWLFWLRHREVMYEMYIEYLCKSWQDLLEATKKLIGNEYYYFHITYLPSHKEEKFKQIDEKLINKYKAFYQKDHYYRRKKKGLANFRYLRWNNIVVVLHTVGVIITTEKIKNLDYRKNVDHIKPMTVGGTINKGLLEHFNRKQIEDFCIEYDDRFADVRQTPVFLNIGEEVGFNIQYLSLPNPKKQISKLENEIKQIREAKKRNQKLTAAKRKKHDYDNLISLKQINIEKLKADLNKKSKKTEGITVKLTKESIKNLKVTFSELAEQKNKTFLIERFNNLNNLPPHRGILTQQWELRKHCLAQAKIHHFSLKPEELKVQNRIAKARELYELNYVRKYTNEDNKK